MSGNELRSLMNVPSASLTNRNDHQTGWEKGSFGISGSIAGLTSEGKNLTNGLDYSSSIMDLASHNQQLSAAALSKETNERVEVQRDDFKF